MLHDEARAIRRYATAAIEPEARFDGGTPSGRCSTRFGHTWVVRIVLFMAAVHRCSTSRSRRTGRSYLLLPVHFVMGPIHGAIVNWCGHKYGYRNFDTTRDDSRATRWCSTS